LLGNGSVNRFPRKRTGSKQYKSGVFFVNRVGTVAMQRRGKHASSTIERLCFLRGPCRGVILKTIGAAVQRKVQLWNVNQRATEAEESPFVTRKSPVKAMQRNSHC
jgi:hypothetical protein